jgi:hypothetical protein
LGSGVQGAEHEPGAVLTGLARRGKSLNKIVLVSTQGSSFWRKSQYLLADKTVLFPNLKKI